MEKGGEMGASPLGPSYIRAEILREGHLLESVKKWGNVTGLSDGSRGVTIVFSGGTF